MKINQFEEDEKLKSIIKESLNKNIEDLDFYKDIEYIDFDYSKLSKQGKGSSHKALAIVASIAFILVLSSTLAIFISNGAVNASYFEIEKTFTALRNSFFGDKDSSDEYVKDDAIIKDINVLDDLNNGIKFFPDLFIPKKIPERFTFKSLKITKNAHDDYFAVYLYEDNDEKILTISQQTVPQGGLSISLVGITEEIKTDDGVIYISENPFGDGGNSATYEKKDFYIDVAGMIKKDEILSVLNQK